MRSFELFTAFWFFASVVSQSIWEQRLSDIKQAFVDAALITDVIPFANFSALVDMTFTSASGESITPSPGQKLTMLQTREAPAFFLTAENRSSLEAYGNLVCIIVDPDAPTPQDRSTSQIIHFLAGNFTLGPSGTMLMNSSEAFMRYWYTLPQDGSDPHRYALLTYLQPPGFDSDVSNYFPDPLNEVKRTGFNVSSFASQLGLGGPIAGNFFTVGPDHTWALTSSFRLPSTLISSSRALPTVTPLSGAAHVHTATPMKALGLVMAAVAWAINL